MILQWQEYNIDLDSFSSWVSTNYSNTDGINAWDNAFEIIETTPLTSTQITDITNYYNSLPVYNDISRLEKFKIAIINYKEALISKSFVDYTTLDKKVAFDNSQIISTEVDQIIANYYS